jgi:prepilin signal peptidase PulO-like enzyme (type II secretory pathway)
VTEIQAVKAGAVFNAGLFPFSAAVSIYVARTGAGGAVFFGAMIAQMFSLTYFFSILLLRIIPFQLMMLPVFGGFFFRLVFLVFSMLYARILFPDTVVFTAASYGVVTVITMIAEAVIFSRIELKKSRF